MVVIAQIKMGKIMRKKRKKRIRTGKEVFLDLNNLEYR